jgi:hypothetical protein
MKDLEYFEGKQYYAKISSLVSIAILALAYIFWSGTEGKLSTAAIIFLPYYSLLFITIYRRIRYPIITVLPDGLIWYFESGNWWKNSEQYVTFADFKNIWLKTNKSSFLGIPTLKRTVDIRDSCDKTGSIIDFYIFKKKDRAEIEELIERIQERINDLTSTGKAKPVYSISVLDLLKER